MNKSDKFYLKQGKLELSMLDDEDDEVVNVSSKNRQISLEEQMLFEHTKRRREQRGSSESKVKVSKDIYNTLHAMGQYLTKGDEMEQSSLPVKKPINTAKAMLIEELASTVKVQDMSLPPLPPKEERLQNTSITKADEIREKAVDISLYAKVDQKESQENLVEADEMSSEETKWYKLEKEAEIQDEAYEQEKGLEKEEESTKPVNESLNKEDMTYDEQFKQLNSEEDVNLEETSTQDESELTVKNEEDPVSNSLYSDEMEQAVTKSYESVSAHHQEEDRELFSKPLDKVEEISDVEEFEEDRNKQRKVDEIVNSFFSDRVPQYPFTKELKKHIDEQIRSLEIQKTKFTG